MNLRILLFGIALFAAGCSGPGGRPITEELPLDEMNSLLKKGSDYRTALVLAENFRKQSSTLDKARANDLTYNRLVAFLENYYDSSVRDRLGSEADEQWNEKFGRSEAGVDSLLAYWQEYLAENNPESYVKVDLVAIIPEESSHGTAKVVLELTPLKGPVDKVEGYFGLFKRGESYSLNEYGTNNRFSFSNLKDPIFIPAWMHYSVWSIRDGDIPYTMYPDRPGLPIPELKQKYVFDYAVSTLVKDGESIDYGEIYMQVPSSVRDYWGADEQRQEVLSEYYRGRIVEELIDPDFVTRTDFVDRYEKAYYRKLDALGAWFMFDRFMEGAPLD